MLASEVLELREKYMSISDKLEKTMNMLQVSVANQDFMMNVLLPQFTSLVKKSQNTLSPSSLNDTLQMAYLLRGEISPSGVLEADQSPPVT